MSAQYSELRWAVMETDEGLVPLTPTEHHGPGAASWRSGTRGRVARDPEGYPQRCTRCRRRAPTLGHVWCTSCWEEALRSERIPWDSNGSGGLGLGGRYTPRERSRRNHLRRLKDEARRAGGGR